MNPPLSAEEESDASRRASLPRRRGGLGVAGRPRGTPRRREGPPRPRRVGKRRAPPRAAPRRGSHPRGPVWRDIHLFPTELVDVPRYDLERGVCQTTGGTSLLPVARHPREHGVRRAVIVTDGQVGPVGESDSRTLRETLLGLAPTSGRERDGELARTVVVLPGLEGDEPAEGDRDFGR